MLLGRFVFGVGGDSFFVGKATIVSSWFKGGELAFAFGITLSVGRLGSMVNGLVINRLVEIGGVPYALYVGFYVCVASILGTVCVISIDYWAQKRDKLQSLSPQSEEKFRVQDLYRLGLPFWLIVANCACLYSTVITYLIISPGIIET